MTESHQPAAMRPRSRLVLVPAVGIPALTRSNRGFF